MRARHAPAVLALGAAVLGLLAAGTAGATGGGGIGIRAAAPGGADPITDGFLTIAVSPGAVASGAVVVSNTTAARVTLSVYATDGETAVTSGAAYGTAGASPAGAGGWVHPDATSIALGAGAQRTLDFTVRVPADATPGDHVAAIAVQRPETPNAGGQLSVSQVVRGVVPVNVRVSGAAAAQARLDTLTLGTLPGTSLPAVLVGIGNSGTLMCHPTLTVSVTSSATATITKARRLDLILPGDTIRYPFPWPVSLAPGTHDLSATATGCGNPVTLRSGGPASPPGNQSGPPPGPSPGTTVAPGAPKPGIARRGHTRPRAHPSAAGRYPSPQTAARRPTSRAPLTAPPSTEPPAAGGSATPRHARPGSPEDPILHVARILAKTTAFPISMLIILIVFVLTQDAIDRRDPKLALAPAYRDPLLSFTADAPAEE